MKTMLARFETVSEPVKGLSFHSKRPWILASLQSGEIQLWDFRMRTIIDRFNGHDGPVRGVDFHKSQPLFVSGGDDCIIKVWNYELHRCLFTLRGHLGHINTVQFHHECPWIVSASDDRTIRIWNMQSRACISVLIGHNDCVMCASFHPEEDFVISASLDKTVRIWDIGALREKEISTAGDVLQSSHMKTDFFGWFDDIAMYVCEGHCQGVKWASFHPTLPLIVSGADDGLLKICHMNDTKAWELVKVDTLTGHTNNVSCALFYARQDIVVSNSEDSSIRIWDAEKGTGLRSLHRQHHRFWVLAAHPERNLLAAGHDAGMVIFKLVRERPAFCVSGDSLVYIKDQFLRAFEYSTQEDTQLIQIRRSSCLIQEARTLSFSPSENAVMICSDVDGGSYELYILSRDCYGRDDTVQESKRGIGVSAVFVGHNEFAVLENKGSNQVLLKNIENEIVEKCALPAAINMIFYAGVGILLCKAEEDAFLFDLLQRTVLGELKGFSFRYVVWSQDMESVAFLSAHQVILADKKLQHTKSFFDKTRIKSGAWDDNGVFIYTTLTHVKYCLSNRDAGIIKSLKEPVYITKIYGSTIFCLDRNGKNYCFTFDSKEYTFKLSLLNKKYEEVLSMSKDSQLCVQTTAAYLQHKGLPEAALYFAMRELVSN